MAHLTSKNPYGALQSRLDKYPVGAPAAETLYEILKIRFTEEEARLGASLPLRPYTLTPLARILKRPEAELKKLLDQMADKGLVMDIPLGSKVYYMLAPTVVGFFEFTFMRRHQDLPNRKLAELLHQYVSVDHQFAYSFAPRGTTTQVGRTLVHETALRQEDLSEILEYEQAEEIIKQAKTRSVGLCYCRHKQHHLDNACPFPLEACMSLNEGADYCINRGFGRKVAKQEMLDLLTQTRQLGLVQIGDNVQRRLTYICNCCGCCCSMLTGIKKYGLSHAVVTSNYICHIDESLCKGCGKCVKRCPIEIIELVGEGKNKKAKVDTPMCLGCGVCKEVCPTEALSMHRRKKRVITPETTMERILTMALERGKLQYYLFDNPNRWTHRMAAALVGAVLNLRPLHQLLLKQNIKSKFIHTLMNQSGSSSGRD